MLLNQLVVELTGELVFIYILLFNIILVKVIFNNCILFKNIFYLFLSIVWTFFFGMIFLLPYYFVLNLIHIVNSDGFLLDDETNVFI